MKQAKGRCRNDGNSLLSAMLAVYPGHFPQGKAVYRGHFPQGKALCPHRFENLTAGTSRWWGK